MANYHDSDFFNNKFFCGDFFQAKWFKQPFFSGIHTHCATTSVKGKAVSADVIADHQVVVTFDRVIPLDKSAYTITANANAETINSISYVSSDHHKVLFTVTGYPFTAGVAVLVSGTAQPKVDAFTDLAAVNTVVAPAPAPKRRRKAK